MGRSGRTPIYLLLYISTTDSTKMPSIAVTAEMDIVPSKVGMSSFLNSAETLSRSKSIASLFIRHSFDKCHGCIGLFLYCKDTNKRARNETFLSQKKREIVAKRTNRVRKCANLFDVNGALTPQKRRNVPIVEDFGPICKEFSS